MPEVLRSGLGPEDMASYVSQQHRWAAAASARSRRCCHARCRCGRRLQYLLSASYFLTGWTLVVYMTLPVIRIVTGAQPVARLTADQFLVHFGPYLRGGAG